MPSYRFAPEAGIAARGETPSAAEVTARLQALGLPAEALTIGCEGDAVSIEGPVPDPTTQERILLAAGNIRGVARVRDRMVPAQRPGLLDAFAGLAHLPGGAASMEAAGERVHQAAPDPGDHEFGPAGSLFHTVQPGETLEAIAERHYGTPLEAVRLGEANLGLLPDGGTLAPGIVLRLPPGYRRGGR